MLQNCIFILADIFSLWLMLKVHIKEIPNGMSKVTFESAPRFSFINCAVCKVNSFSFFFFLLLQTFNLKPNALDSYLPTGKRSAVNDSVI